MALAGAGLGRFELAVLKGFGDVRLASTQEATLTSAGARRAVALTRAHRWWEQYLVSHARHDPAHADLVADVLEHADDETFIEELRAELGLAGEGALPASPHPLVGGGGGEGRDAVRL
jgi:Mn-dependent DtxR family transcriptional regulator